MQHYGVVFIASVYSIMPVPGSSTMDLNNKENFNPELSVFTSQPKGFLESYVLYIEYSKAKTEQNKKRL